jgi:hypothetical protein
VVVVAAMAHLTMIQNSTPQVVVVVLVVWI